MKLHQRTDRVINLDQETRDSDPQCVDTEPVDAAHARECYSGKVMLLGDNEQYRPTAAIWRKHSQLGSHFGQYIPNSWNSGWSLSVHLAGGGFCVQRHCHLISFANLGSSVYMD